LLGEIRRLRDYLRTQTNQNVRRLREYLHTQIELDTADRWILSVVGLVFFCTLGALAALAVARSDAAPDSAVKVFANGSTLTGTLVTTTTPAGSTLTVIRYETRKGEKRYLSTTAAGVTVSRQGTTAFLLGERVTGANVTTTIRHAVPGPTVTHTNTVTHVQTVTETQVQTVTETQVQTVTETVPGDEP
jgi:hypothetical protein